MGSNNRTDHLIGTNEAAVLLGVSRYSIVRYIQKKQLKARLVGCFYGIAVSELKRFMKEREG